MHNEAKRGAEPSVNSFAVLEAPSLIGGSTADEQIVGRCVNECNEHIQEQ